MNVTHNDAPDVIVIGGGILGVSAAAELAETGRRVVLLERIGIGAGASGRNSGVVQHPFDPVLARLYVATLACYRRLADRVDDGFRLPDEPVGLLSVTHDVALVRRLAQRLAERFPELRPTFLDPAAARAVEPSLAEGVAACRLEVGFPIAPIAATGAYARLTELVGVEIRMDDVAGLWQADGRARGVILADGSRLPPVPWSSRPGRGRLHSSIRQVDGDRSGRCGASSRRSGSWTRPAMCSRRRRSISSRVPRRTRPSASTSVS